MRVLAFDPGKAANSFAFSFLEEGVVRCYGLIRPITSLKHPEFSAEADDFSLRISKLVNALKLQPGVDAIVAERFMDRGGASKGATGEHINIMLGLMQAAVRPHPLELVMPATWKSHMARSYLTGKNTKKQRTVVPNMWMHLRGRFAPHVWPKDKQARMIIHEADACGIALWRYETADLAARSGSIGTLIDRSTVKIRV